jgi:hypothetical protein
MNTKPIDDVLPRIADEYLQKILDDFSKTIDEVVNFGTHIILWDIEYKREGKDNNIPTLFLRNIIELADSISVLTKNSLIDPAKIQIRALLENHFGLLYMLQKDERQRALSFMVWRAKKDLKYYKQFVSVNPSSKEFKAKILKDKMNIDITKFFDRPDVINGIEAKVTLLKKPEFKEVHLEYMRTSEKLNTNNPNWYSLYDGPNNFQEMSNRLKKTIAYEFQYRKYSENVHVTGIQKGFAKTGKDEAQIIQIRDFEHCKDVFTSTVSYLLECYTEYLTKRIPEKRNELTEWYKDFKEPYNRIVSESVINYKK